MKSTVILLLSFLFLFSCQRQNQFESFFEQTFNIIESESLLRDSINWIGLKETVRDSIKYFNSNDDAYKAIGYTVKLVNDGHSLFLVSNKSSKKHLQRIKSRTPIYVLLLPLIQKLLPMT